MNKYLTQIADVSWVNVIVLSVLLGALYYFTSGDESTALMEKKDALVQQLSTSQTTLDETKKAVANADRFEMDVKSLARKFENIVNYMPETMSSSEMTSIINSQAQIAGAIVKKIDPKSGEDKVDFFAVTKVNLTLEGTYAQIATFLSLLSKVPKLLIFEKSELVVLNGGDPESPRLTFVGTLQGYRYVGDKTSLGKEGVVNATK